ncbi:hypothetical protein TIFTF001_030183 [Ficus carica]|uniref:Uncharacterized protein n=1 Tax=Ficus carica TaxID=3494 RepID=A0AA88DT64_FICCA|nr:hypothetical protein TIFTF001_030183 [Ficus carica]
MHPQSKLEQGFYGSSMGIKPGWMKEKAKKGATLFYHPIYPCGCKKRVVLASCKDSPMQFKKRCP